jgi:hypothetical protein
MVETLLLRREVMGRDAHRAFAAGHARVPVLVGRDISPQRLRVLRSLVAASNCPWTDQPADYAP